MMELFADRYAVKERVRRRRRGIAASRRMKTGRKAAQRILIIMCVCLAIGFFGYIGVQGGEPLNTGLTYGVSAAEEPVYAKVTVYSGDTIWGIASVYADPSKDIRQLVKEICDLNHVAPGKIYPGQTLLVPVSSNQG